MAGGDPPSLHPDTVYFHLQILISVPASYYQPAAPELHIHFPRHQIEDYSEFL